MLNDLHLAHITGTATINNNSFFNDNVTFNRPRYSVGQMFFKPYESKKEFIFCARNTFQPLVQIGIGVLSPIGALIGAAILPLASMVSAAVSVFYKCIGNECSAFSWLNFAEDLFSRFCQAVINLAVLPIAAATMLTRGISTGLKAAGIYDYDASKTAQEPSGYNGNQYEPSAHAL